MWKQQETKHTTDRVHRAPVPDATPSMKTNRHNPNPMGSFSQIHYYLAILKKTIPKWVAKALSEQEQHTTKQVSY